MPSGFFDEGVAPMPVEAPTEPKSSDKPETPTGNTAQSLPQGFFDDANKDNAVRKQPQPDLNDEFEKFQEEITSVVQAAEQDDEKKQEELDKFLEKENQQLQSKLEAVKNKSLELKRLREQLAAKKEKKEEPKPATVELQEDIDDFFDWRSKG